MLNVHKTLTMRKTVIQKHRMTAFLKTLDVLETSLQGKINFIVKYNEIYHFPSAIARNNLRHYRRSIKAVQQLKNESIY